MKYEIGDIFYDYENGRELTIININIPGRFVNGEDIGDYDVYELDYTSKEIKPIHYGVTESFLDKLIEKMKNMTEIKRNRLQKIED